MPRYTGKHNNQYFLKMAISWNATIYYLAKKWSETIYRRDHSKNRKWVILLHLDYKSLANTIVEESTTMHHHSLPWGVFMAVRCSFKTFSSIINRRVIFKILPVLSLYTNRALCVREITWVIQHIIPTILFCPLSTTLLALCLG